VREYVVHAPPSYTPDKAYPLVLVFHGAGRGSPEEAVDLTGMNDVADAFEFLVVYPRNMFDPEPVPTLLDHLVGTWNVDAERIHAAGFSRGGSLVYRLAIEMPERFGSVAPVSANRNGIISLSRPVSLITFQGSIDRLSPAWKTLNAAWDDAAGCSAEILTTIAMPDGPTDVSTKTCTDGTEHAVYSVSGMGHTWPAGGSELIWEFFARHPLP
jgi:polyhydroxybutyrate depolymerase